jgi:two-component system, OmpR family, phosphate regulon response regulator OmpR
LDVNPNSTLLFVVEDDPAARQMLCDYLVKQGFGVVALTSAEELLLRIHRNRPDLVILDVSLPGMSGLQACKQLRHQGDKVPIILLTALTEEIDRVLGFEMGADDYLGKPYSPRELVGRVRAVLRRVGLQSGLLSAAPDIQMGQVVFQPHARCISWADGRQMTLGSVDYALLFDLATNPQVVISRERLLASAHGNSHTFLPRTVDVAVMRLRKIIEPNPAEPRHLQTVRNRGYVFIP